MTQLILNNCVEQFQAVYLYFKEAKIIEISHGKGLSSWWEKEQQEKNNNGHICTMSQLFC